MHTIRFLYWLIENRKQNYSADQVRLHDSIIDTRNYWQCLNQIVADV